MPETQNDTKMDVSWRGTTSRGERQNAEEIFKANKQKMSGVPEGKQAGTGKEEQRNMENKFRREEKQNLGAGKKGASVSTQCNQSRKKME